MLRKKAIETFTILVLVTLIIGWQTVAKGATIRFSDTTPNAVLLGETFEATIVGENFSSNSDLGIVAGSAGGGLNLYWDPTILQFDSITLTFPGDRTFATLDDTKISNGKLNFGVVSFAGTTKTTFEIASIQFTAFGIGETSLDLEPDNVNVWVDYDFNKISPEILDAAVTVVPIPSTSFLLGGGLVGLFGIRRRVKRS